MKDSYNILCKHTEEFKRHAESSMSTIVDVINWGRDKGLNDPKAQLNKVIEEVGEIAHEVTRNHYDLSTGAVSDELSDAIGDTLVTVLILSDILGEDPMACLAEAYEQIKGRSGEVKNGTFVKEEK